MLPYPGTTANALAILEQVPPVLLLTQSPKPMLPSSIRDRLVQDLTQRQGLTPNQRAQLTVKTAEPATWPNSCLGLPRAEEFCAQVLTPGWRVTLTDGNNTWIYRTDRSGKNVRPESGSS